VASLLFVQLVRRFGLKEVAEVVYLVLRVEMDVNDQLLLLGFRLRDARPFDKLRDRWLSLVEARPGSG